MQSVNVDVRAIRLEQGARDVFRAQNRAKLMRLAEIESARRRRNVGKRTEFAQGGELLGGRDVQAAARPRQRASR